MNASNTTEEQIISNFSTKIRVVFSCSHTPPQFIFDLNRTTHQFTIVVTSIACPATILLNFAVILAMTGRKELKTNSNILLSSLATTDLLVGAVSMPLAITLDALLLQEDVIIDVVCAIDLGNGFVTYICYATSFYHLVVISWERYVAVVRWPDYKTIVTKNRVKKYSVMAWILALLSVGLIFLIDLNYGDLPGEVVLVSAAFFTLFGTLCLLSMVYFYVMVYRGVRKWNRSQIRRRVNDVLNTKLETKAAYTAVLLTLFVGISAVPSFMIYSLKEVWPSVQKRSFFRCTETMLLLNSLFNPILYCYRNRSIRKVVWDLLGSGKSQRIHAVDINHKEQVTSKNVKNRDSVLSLHQVVNVEQEKANSRFTRSQSCSAHMCLDRVQQKSNELPIERAASAPPSVMEGCIHCIQDSQAVDCC